MRERSVAEVNEGAWDVASIAHFIGLSVCSTDSLQEQCTRCNIENGDILLPLHDAWIQTS